MLCDCGVLAEWERLEATEIQVNVRLVWDVTMRSQSKQQMTECTKQLGAPCHKAMPAYLLQ